MYDKDAERGCPLCLEGAPATTGGAEKPEQGQKLRFGIVIGLVAVIAAGVAWFALRQEPPPPAPPPLDTTALLDPGEAWADSSDPRPIRQARAYATALQRASGGRAALLRFSEGPVDTLAEGRAERLRARSYHQFSTRWHATLDRAKPDSQLFYRPGARYSSQLETVNNFLGAARSSLRQAAPPDRVLTRAERLRHLDSARGYLNSALTVLSELPSAAPARPATRRPARRR